MMYFNSSLVKHTSGGFMNEIEHIASRLTDNPNIILEDIEDYAQGGMVKLYHFTSRLRHLPSKVLHPGQSANYYSRREMSAASTPRLFFYVDPKQKESFFGQSNEMYTVTVPVSDIYHIPNDPEGIVKEWRSSQEYYQDFDLLMKAIKDAGYKGQYTKRGFDCVEWFYPIEVTLSDSNS